MRAGSETRKLRRSRVDVMVALRYQT